MLKKDRSHLVNGLIYPVPNPDFPFLGVHLTRMMNGAVEAGPNAVLALKREGYRKSDFSFHDTYESLSWPGFQKIAFKYWRVGLYELYRSFVKSKFLQDLQKMVPELRSEDLVPAEAGVRAQAVDRNGMIDDFDIVEGNGFMHVRNAPSPAATSSVAIGQFVAERIRERWV